MWCNVKYLVIHNSGGFRGYPIDWTGCIFVTFNFCPIIWIFGHRLIPCMAAWLQKQNTEHALMTGADTDRSLQLVLDRSRPWDSYLESSKAACALASLSDTELQELVQPRLTGRQRNRANVPAASPEEYYRCTVGYSSRLWITSRELTYLQCHLKNTTDVL